MQYSNKREKTQKQIFQAYSTLLREKKISQITVKDVCALASINRSTFYTYFLDIYQLEECLEEHIIKDSMEYIHKHISSIDDINAENLGIIITNVFRSSDNLPVYIIKNSQGALADRLTRIFLDVAKSIKPDLNSSQIDTIKFYIKYHLAGIAAITVDWDHMSTDNDPEAIINMAITAATEGPLTAIKKLLH